MSHSTNFVISFENPTERALRDQHITPVNEDAIDEQLAENVARELVHLKVQGIRAEDTRALVHVKDKSARDGRLVLQR